MFSDVDLSHTLSIQQRSICVIRMLTTGNGNVLVKGKVLCGQREQQEGHMTITQLGKSTGNYPANILTLNISWLTIYSRHLVPQKCCLKTHFLNFLGTLSAVILLFINWDKRTLHFSHLW